MENVSRQWHTWGWHLTWNGKSSTGHPGLERKMLGCNISEHLCRISRHGHSTMSYMCMIRLSCCPCFNGVHSKAWPLPHSRLCHHSLLSLPSSPFISIILFLHICHPFPLSLSSFSSTVVLFGHLCHHSASSLSLFCLLSIIILPPLCHCSASSLLLFFVLFVVILCPYYCHFFLFVSLFFLYNIIFLPLCFPSSSSLL